MYRKPCCAKPAIAPNKHGPSPFLLTLDCSSPESSFIQSPMPINFSENIIETKYIIPSNEPSIDYNISMSYIHSTCVQNPIFNALMCGITETYRLSNRNTDIFNQIKYAPLFAPDFINDIISECVDILICYVWEKVCPSFRVDSKKKTKSSQYKKTKLNINDIPTFDPSIITENTCAEDKLQFLNKSLLEIGTKPERLTEDLDLLNHIMKNIFKTLECKRTDPLELDSIKKSFIDNFFMKNDFKHLPNINEKIITHSNIDRQAITINKIPLIQQSEYKKEHNGKLVYKDNYLFENKNSIADKIKLYDIYCSNEKLNCQNQNDCIKNENNDASYLNSQEENVLSKQCSHNIYGPQNSPIPDVINNKLTNKLLHNTARSFAENSEIDNKMSIFVSERNLVENSKSTNSIIKTHYEYHIPTGDKFLPNEPDINTQSSGKVSPNVDKYIGNKLKNSILDHDCCNPSVSDARIISFTSKIPRLNAKVVSDKSVISSNSLKNNKNINISSLQKNQIEQNIKNIKASKTKFSRRNVDRKLNKFQEIFSYTMQSVPKNSFNSDLGEVKKTKESINKLFEIDKCNLNMLDKNTSIQSKTLHKCKMPTKINKKTNKLPVKDKNIKPTWSQAKIASNDENKAEHIYNKTFCTDTNKVKRNSNINISQSDKKQNMTNITNPTEKNTRKTIDELNFISKLNKKKRVNKISPLRHKIDYQNIAKPYISPKKETIFSKLDPNKKEDISYQNIQHYEKNMLYEKNSESKSFKRPTISISKNSQKQRLPTFIKSNSIDQISNDEIQLRNLFSEIQKSLIKKIVKDIISKNLRNKYSKSLSHKNMKDTSKDEKVIKKVYHQSLKGMKKTNLQETVLPSLKHAITSNYIKSATFDDNVYQNTFHQNCTVSQLIQALSKTNNLSLDEYKKHTFTIDSDLIFKYQYSNEVTHFDNIEHFEEYNLIENSLFHAAFLTISAPIENVFHYAMTSKLIINYCSNETVSVSQTRNELNLYHQIYILCTKDENVYEQNFKTLPIDIKSQNTICELVTDYIFQNSYDIILNSHHISPSYNKIYSKPTRLFRNSTNKHIQSANHKHNTINMSKTLTNSLNINKSSFLTEYDNLTPMTSSNINNPNEKVNFEENMFSTQSPEWFSVETSF